MPINNEGLDGYEIQELIGRGGFASVYRAHDLAHSRYVAIKVLSGRLEEAEQRRFDRERSAVGQLAAHPNVVPVLDSGYTAEGEAYLILEFEPGGTLADLVKSQGPMPWRNALDTVLAVTGAIEVAHSMGIRHRDIKPENVLLSSYGVPKLADFGIASVATAATTTVGSSVTLSHSPPEMLEGARPTDAVDIYSLASTFHYLVSGSAPFARETDQGVAAMITRVLRDDPPPLVGFGVPVAVDAEIKRAMSKRPGNRHQSAAEFRQSLTLAAGDASDSTSPPSTAADQLDVGSEIADLPPMDVPEPRKPGMPSSTDTIAVADVPLPFDQARLVDKPAVGATTPPVGHGPPPQVPSTDAPSARRGLLFGAIFTVLAVVAAVAAWQAIRESDDTALDTGSSPETTEARSAESDEGATSQPDGPAVQDLPAGARVVISGPRYPEPELVAIQTALETFGQEAGIDIEYRGSRQWEADLERWIEDENSPDILLTPASRLVDLAWSGHLIALPDDVTAAMTGHWEEPWTSQGLADGAQFGLPIGADTSSLVWYQPGIFEAEGFFVPETFDQFLGLTDEMIARGRTPLCVGIESGEATGWVFTQWVSELVLRFEVPDVYDQWVTHEIAFDDERIVRQMQRVLDLWNTEGMVFAAGGSISTTAFDDSAQPLVDGDCLMHLQGSFYSNYFKGVPFADGSADAVDVFRFPSDQGREITGSVTLAGALADRPEVWAVMVYLSGPEYANRRQETQRVGVVAGSDFLTAVNGLDLGLYTPLGVSIVELLRGADVIRGTAGDLVPPEVGAAWWTEGTAAVNGEQSAGEAAAKIEMSWPS